MPIHIRLFPPADPQPVARGFYQPDDETLLVLLHYPGEQPRYFNHLENDQVRIETDVKGRLLSLEVLIPRSAWDIVPLPDHSRLAAEPMEMHFLDFRTPLQLSALLTTPKRDVLHIQFEPSMNDQQPIHLTENLSATVAEGCLLSLSISGLTIDRGGRAIKSWRKEMAILPIGP